jgi:hypothetical protein
MSETSSLTSQPSKHPPLWYHLQNLVIEGPFVLAEFLSRCFGRAWKRLCGDEARKTVDPLTELEIRLELNELEWRIPVSETLGSMGLPILSGAITILGFETFWPRSDKFGAQNQSPSQIDPAELVPLDGVNVEGTPFSLVDASSSASYPPQSTPTEDDPHIIDLQNQNPVAEVFGGEEEFPGVGVGWLVEIWRGFIPTVEG